MLHIETAHTRGGADMGRQVEGKRDRVAHASVASTEGFFFLRAERKGVRWSGVVPSLASRDGVCVSRKFYVGVWVTSVWVGVRKSRLVLESTPQPLMGVQTLAQTFDERAARLLIPRHASVAA